MNDVKIIFIIAVAFTILITFQCIRLMHNNFELNARMLELEKVVYTLDTKLMAEQGISRGLRIELEKCKYRGGKK